LVDLASWWLHQLLSCLPTRSSIIVLCSF
jgi:hypothetical protein